MAIAKSGISEYTLIKGLVKRPAFYKSPVWEAKSRDYFSIADDLGMKVDRKLVANAIANNWSGAAFAKRLRELPGYLGSNEFKTTEASLGNVFRSIFGEPDETRKLEIKEYALGGWTPDQFAARLRGDPEYRNSAEYQSKIYGLQSLLGFLPKQAPAPPPIPGAREPVPNSPRVPGTPNRPHEEPAYPSWKPRHR
jgi:hypothetical protein